MSDAVLEGESGVKREESIQRQEKSYSGEFEKEIWSNEETGWIEEEESRWEEGREEIRSPGKRNCLRRDRE